MCDATDTEGSLGGGFDTGFGCFGFGFGTDLSFGQDAGAEDWWRLETTLKW